MRLTTLISAMAFSLLATLGCSAVAFAQSDCKTLVKAFLFGLDDETGSTRPASRRKKRGTRRLKSRLITIC